MWIWRAQALPPQADALQRPQEGGVPLKPLIVTVAPLLIVDQDALSVVVDLLDGRRVPAGMTAQAQVKTASLKATAAVEGGGLRTISCGGLGLLAELQSRR